MDARRLVRSLYFQVIIAILLGVTLGSFYPQVGEAMKPLGDGFIKLIKMLIGPVIFCTVVQGIAHMDNVKKLGRIGGKALIYFEVLSTLALGIGLVVVNTVKPGAGMNVDPRTLDGASVSKLADGAQSHGVVDLFMGIIPDTFVGAFSDGKILQVLFVAILFGCAMTLLGKRSEGMVILIDEASTLFFKMITMLMKLAPVGAFGAMSFTIGKYGLGSLEKLGCLMVCFYATCLLFVFVVLGTLAHLIGFSLLKLLRYIGDELMLVLGTSSSEPTLPTLMAKLERLGVPKDVVGIVVPTGYSFNLDGSSIYYTMAAMFIAQALGLDLSLREQVTLLAVLMLTSKGSAAVSGSGFVTLAATLTAVPTIPVAGMALILGIDRFMSEARSLTNLVGNTVATLVVARWENSLNLQQLRRELDSSTYGLPEVKEQEAVYSME